MKRIILSFCFYNHQDPNSNKYFSSLGHLEIRDNGFTNRKTMKLFQTIQYIFCIYIFFAPFRLTAQTDYNKISIASPNAASLGKFVDIPVNYHTGIPQVNIPVSTIKDGSLELPISLSYHAGGIKVADQAGWIGAGWALNAGGVITRTVRGIPDEAINTNLGQRGHFSNYGFNNYYAENPTGNVQDMAINDNNVLTRVYDGEPDLFFFNFNGHSGKFYFNDDRIPVLVSANEDLKIDYFYGLPVSSATFLDKNIQGFCITTGDGTKYFFGKTQTEGPSQGVYPVEISVPFDFSIGLSSDRVVSSWYLNKIESVDKSSTINLFYEAETFSSYSWSYFPIEGSLSPTNKGYSLSKLFTLGIRLSKIVFSQGTVLFSVSDQPRLDLASGPFLGSDHALELPNTEAKALKEITISNNNTILKKMAFHTSYFNDNTTSLPPGSLNLNLVTDTKRLKLDSVLEIGANGQALKPYKFNYYSNFLPRRLSFAIDHWGFYNAASNSSVLPTLTSNTYTIINPGGANRESSWPSMQNGALNKITYPTGGSTDFEFEANVAKVDAVRYNLVYDKQYWVGFDGAYSKEWTDLSFTGTEKYEFKFYNTPCASGITNCIASYSIIGSDGTVHGSGSAAPGVLSTQLVTLQPGVYKIRLRREGAYSGTGATLTISKFTPTAVRDVIVGGLRVKKIIKNGLNGVSTPIVENYSYTDGGRSTGFLFERPYYIAPVRSDLVARVGMVAVESGTNAYNSISGCLFYINGTVANSPVIISPVSVAPLSSVQGNHIGYGSVRVDQNLNGYSIYKYNSPSTIENNIDDVAYRNIVSGACDPRSPSWPRVPLPFEFERGELKAEYHFEANDQLLQVITYRSSFDSTKVYTPAIIIKDIPLLARTFSEYQLRGYWKKYVVRSETYIDKQTLKEVYKNDTTFFSSPFHRSATKKAVDQSTGGTLVTNFKYALDYRLPVTEAIPDGWSTYQADCNTCNIEYINRISDPTSTAGTRKFDFHRYRMCLALARKKYVDYRRINFTDVVNNFSTAHLNSKNNADVEFKPILEMQDQFINSPIESTNFKNNKLTGAVYNRFSYETIMPNVYLSEIKRINISSPSTYTATSNTNSSIIKDPRYETEFLYKSVKGNVIEQQKAFASKDVILWSYKNKYPVAEIKNTDYATIEILLGGAAAINNFSNSNPTDAQVSAFLAPLKAALPNAQITSYTYTPLVGVTSMTDARGMTTYFEYDEFQRLKYIKDQNYNIIKVNDYHYKP